MKTRRFSLILVIALTALFAPLAKAATVMDQIGPSGAFFTGRAASSSQRFDSANAAFNIAAVDNFSITGATQLTNVSAALLGFNGFTSYSNVTGYEVNIYSSAAAAASNINGNIFHMVFTPAQVSLTMPFSGDALSALVSIPISALLSAAGTYFVSVVPDLNFTPGGQIGVYATTGLPGSNPGDSNGFQVNPGGGFGFAGNISNNNADFAYRITGQAPTTVPETGGTFIFLGLGLTGLLLARRALAF